MRHAATLDTPLRRRLADVMIARRDEWRQECQRVWASDPVWSPETRADCVLAFAAHRAAIDREERAAACYAEAVEQLCKLLWSSTE